MGGPYERQLQKVMGNIAKLSYCRKANCLMEACDGSMLGASATPSVSPAMNVPKHEWEALVRILPPDIRAFFESEEGMREFAEWETQQKH